MSEPSNFDAIAERHVLAACLISPVARAEAKRALTGADFWDTRHETIWDAMARLERHGKSVDAATVLATLGSNRACIELMPDLVTLPVVPDHTGDHAAIVREWGIRRRLYGLATTVVQQALNPDLNAVGYAATVATRFANLRDAGLPDTTTAETLAELLAEPDDEPDWLIPHLLERRDRLMLTGEEGLGKALAIDTPIPTPKGWTTMGELVVGDEVFSDDGNPARIVAATDVMHDRPCYCVNFSDGTQIVADERHLWQTRDYKARQPRAFTEREAPTRPRGTDQRHKRAGYEPAVRTTRALAETLYARSGHTLNHSIDTCAPLNYPTQEQPVDPYVLGAWLGDGSSASSYITTHPDDHEILDRIRKTWPVRETRRPYMWAIGDGKGRGKRDMSTFLGCLRRIGVYGNKHIPEGYLRAGIGQRLALLQGLMDTDGTVGTGPAPIAELTVCSERLARDVHELLLGLGVKVKWAEGPAKIDGRIVGTRYRLAFQTNLPVFHLRRKAERLVPPRTERYRRRYITAVERVESVPVRCIQVAREDGMFLAGRECIPTHNSQLLRQVATMAAAGLDPFETHRIRPLRVTIIDCENSRNQVRRKIRPMVEVIRRLGGQDPTERVVIDCTPRMDITRDKDLARIHQLLDATIPDIVVIGPLYRLVPRALQTDDEAAPVLAALDTVRDRDISLLIEAHAGHTLGKGGNRDLRPRGSSALLGWPEFGYGLRSISASFCDVVPWRGDRDERRWPTRMRRESNGPRWLPVDDFDYEAGIA